MTPGWYPDPSGRFPQRYFDGQRWTEQVVGANGMATTDVVPDGAAMAAPSPPAPSAPAPSPPEQASTTRPNPGLAQPAETAAPGQPSRRLSWIGVAIAGVGALVTLLSCTVLPWADDTSFGDLRKLSDEMSSSSYDDVKLASQYGSWGWFIALFLVAVGIGLVAALVNRRDGTSMRLVVALVAAVAAMSHAGYVAQMFQGPGPSADFGAWAGSVGYLVTIVGLSVATPRTRRNP